MDLVTGRVSGYPKSEYMANSNLDFCALSLWKTANSPRGGGGYLFIEPARTGDTADTAAGGVEQARRELDEDCGMVLL